MTAARPLRTKVGQPRPVPADWRRACAAADGSPAAYPPAKPSRLTIRGAVAL